MTIKDDKMGIKSLLNNKVVKAGSWYTITEFFIKGIAFLTIPIFSRLLTPADYGIVSLYMTWVGIFTILISLNLNTSIVKAKYDFEEDFNTFVSSMIFLSMLIFLGYLIIFRIFNDTFLNITGLSTKLFYFMVFQAYFSFIRTSMIVKLRVEYNYKLVSIVSILISVLGVLFSLYLITGIFENKAYLGNIIGNGVLIYISGIIFLAMLIIPGRHKLWKPEYWKYALLISTPMILHSLSSIVNAQFDRIVISRYIGETATGLYSFAYNVGMIILVLTHALDQAWSPWVYEKMKKKEYKTIKSNAAIYRNFFSVAYAGLLYFSPEIIKIMAPKNYWEALGIIPFIFSGYYLIYMYTFEVKTEFFFGKTTFISLGSLVSAIINIVLNIIFVPKYGYFAAAITTTTSYLFLFIFHYFTTSVILKKRVYGIRFHLMSITHMVVITLYFVLFRDVLFMRLIGIFIIFIMGGLYLMKINR